MNDLLNDFTGTVRRAVDDYHMIEAGDRVAVGVSGGKDSLVLLLALDHLKSYYPKCHGPCPIYSRYSITVLSNT